MNTNDKEEKLEQKLKHPKTGTSDIAKLIDDTIKKKHNVYLMTDWHLWRRKEKGKPECNKHINFNQIINNIKKIHPDDLLINLGDLVDGEFEDKESLKNILLPMNFKKVMVMGNNDLFGNTFYKSCGFDYVVDSFIWHDTLFTHIPVRHNHHMNIHGHIHGYKTYWVPYNNHVDVAYLGGRTDVVKLMDAVHVLNKYSKLIKECPEHFDEGYVHKPKDLFTSEMFDSRALNNLFVEDPYND